MTRIFLTHNRAALKHYYGESAYRMLAGMAQVAFHDNDSEPTRDDIVRQARDCDILVSFRIPPIDAQLLAALPRLAAVCRVAVDIRNIDVDYASRHGILVTRATPGFGASVSEWVVGAMVMLARHMGPATCAYQNGQRPVPLMGTELRAATLGIIGYGTIGRYLAGLARAFGMRLVINDPHVRVDNEPGVTQATLHELLAQSDFVVCLAPALAETARLMNLPAFRKMKPSAYFINASRAELVDEDDLLQALDAGLIAGCALDVGSAQDQMPPARLAAHPRVVATPHIGGLTPQASEHQAMDSVRQVRALLEGRMPECSVNAAHATRARDRFGLRLPPQ